MTLVLAAALLTIAAPLPDEVAQLAWLAGAWEGDDKGTWNEEVWADPKGGMMLAFHRDTRGDRAISFEFRPARRWPAQRGRDSRSADSRFLRTSVEDGLSSSARRN